ncbi:MAG: tRNA (adenosine(37)-N6)-threonylcarbamoyltransferase complex transferase subunit TsaD [Flavobacteriaceae bacterium]|nr:tRNA (adenosine(37)-N6)-threonylcarbamoyltransferase complex transferase subunit TsaD [Flavobacteriaceae bacterium]
MKKRDIYILGIESSCDETSAAVLLNDKVLSNCIANQEIHKDYGGVVPELASRAHQSNIIPVVEKSLSDANINKNRLSAIAFTNGPGLLGSLLVGSSFSKSISLGLDIPLISVNHMHAHLFASFISRPNFRKPRFPFLGVNISGGHTQLIIVKDFFKMKLIGNTLDDAIGEAFDKCGKILGLHYPAGPMIDRLSSNGDRNKFLLPIAKVKNFDFSYSGVKTAFQNLVIHSNLKDSNFIKNNISDLCASLQKSLVESVIKKIELAAKKFSISEIVIGGGVSANSEMRKLLKELSSEKNWNVYIPPIEYTTDNAAMIGIVGYFKYIHNKFDQLNITPSPRFKI